MGKLAKRREPVIDRDAFAIAQLTAVFKEFVSQQNTLHIQTDGQSGRDLSLSSFYKTCTTVIQSAAFSHSLFQSTNTFQEFTSLFTLSRFLSFAEAVGLSEYTVASMRSDTEVEVEASILRARQVQRQSFDAVVKNNSHEKITLNIAGLTELLASEIAYADSTGEPLLARRVLEISQAIENLIRAQTQQQELFQAMGNQVAR